MSLIRGSRYLFVRGIICLEWNQLYVQDAWRDLTMPRPGASVLNPVPTDSPSPNPAEFEPPLDGTQMSSKQVRYALVEQCLSALVRILIAMGG